MEFTVILIFIAAMLIAWYVNANLNAGPRFKSVACKPHKWAYCDQMGWVEDGSPDEEERLKYAVLVCKLCRRGPQETTDSQNGVYE